MEKEIAVIAALSNNNVIAKDGKIPWRIPDDILHFRELTIPHPVIMGRRTYESLPDKFRPLPHRTNIVVTRDPDYQQENIIVAHGIKEAIEKAINQSDLSFVIGGGDIYRQAMVYATKMYLTRVHQVIPEDNLLFFPEINLEEWQEINRQKKDGYTFIDYKRHHWSC